MKFWKYLFVCFLAISLLLVVGKTGNAVNVAHGDNNFWSQTSITGSTAHNTHYEINQVGSNISTDCEKHGSSPVHDDKQCCVFGSVCSAKCFGVAVISSGITLLPQEPIVHSAFVAQSVQPFDRGLPPFRPPRA